jgi:hypothetical protein
MGLLNLGATPMSYTQKPNCHGGTVSAMLIVGCMPDPEAGRSFPFVCKDIDER